MVETMMERYEVKSSELHLAFDPEQSGLTTVYLASEADARIANVIATYSLENSDLKNRAAELEREISLYKNSEFFQVCARVVDLERQLAMANDAAAKGEKARLKAAGMEERIAELETAVLDGIEWADEQIPPDVFKRMKKACGL